jgi:hypothetical protein
MARFAVWRDAPQSAGHPFIVVNVVEAESEAACAHLAPVVEAPDEVGIDWLYDGLDFYEPSLTLDKPTLKALAASCRWTFEQGGMTLPAVPFGAARIATDTAAQTKISSAKTAFDNGTLTGTVKFKTEGGFVDADASLVTAVYGLIVSHVQDAYARESEACDEIEAGTITTQAQVEAVFAS